MSWDVDLLHYGTQRVPGTQVFHQSRWDTWQTFHFYVLLLTSPDGVVLIDCGMDDPAPLNVAIEQNMGAENCIRHVASGGRVTDLLSARGIAPSDVSVVALTHLHADHAGNAALFPRASFVVGRRGWEAHLRRRTTHAGLVAPPAFPADALALLDEADRSGRLVLADDGDEAVEGLAVRTIDGHTDDSTGYVIDSTAGALVVPGDTIWTFENLERDVPVGSYIDLPACYDAMEWARAAGDGVLPSHEPLLMERHPDFRVRSAA